MYYFAFIGYDNLMIIQEMINMADIQKFDKPTLDYFNTLPMALREEIVQSSIQIGGIEDLKKYYENVLSTEQCENGSN